MSTTPLWATILYMGALNVSLRTCFLLLPDRVMLPALVRRALRYVPAAVLTAIYAPELLVQSGQIDASLGNVRLLAGIVAILIAWRLRQTFSTIVAGMIALHLFGAFSGWFA